MIRSQFQVLMLALIASTSLNGVSVAEENWAYWRGPRYDGTSNELNLPETWDPKGGEGSNVLWRTEIGVRSTPVLMNQRLYVLTNSHVDDPTKAGEKVVCLDAKTGEPIWEYGFNVYLSDVPIERVGWSSVVADPESGNVYAQGVCGYFCCLNGETGELVWDHSMHEEYGMLSTYGGRTNFPIIHENNVIISAVVIGWGEMAKPAHRFIAFDKSNGQPVWFNGTTPLPSDTTYSPPVLAVIDGVLQMIFASGDGGVHGFEPRTGKLLWKYMVSGRGVNTPPLVVGNKVYCGQAEENLDVTDVGSVFCIDATKRGDITESGQLWKRNGILLRRAAPLMIGNRLYVPDDRAKLHCLNAETGESIGEEVRMGTMMRSCLLYADGKIYAHEANGRGYVLRPNDTGAEILHKFRMPNGEEFHGSPICCSGRIYIPSSGAMYCIGLKDAEVAQAELPDLPQENAVSTDQVPTQLQLVPVESLLRPGTRQPFDVRLYNSSGQYLRNANSGEATFTVEGPGEIDELGRYTIKGDQKEAAAVAVKATLGELVANARVRVVPELDWAYDFDNGDIPITWVGIRYRAIPLDFDLLTKLKAENELTKDMYIYFSTEFTNVAPKREFDDSTPKQTWTNLLRFLGLSEGENRPKTLEQAQAIFDPAIKRLQEEKVVATAEWTTWDRPTGNGDETVKEPRLTITKGERKIDGNGVMCKIATIPLGTRSQGWMGHPDFHDYTVQSDVYALNRDGRLPDIGLVNQRYTLDMMGASQKLQFRTWTPQLNRFSVDVPYEWQVNVWYTMKFMVSNKDGKAILKAKVWKKGEEEPADWTIAGEDPVPNESGSPGVFGNAKDAEILYDNLTVTRNPE